MNDENETVSLIDEAPTKNYEEKIWNGDLPVFINPIYIHNFKNYSREVLNER